MEFGVFDHVDANGTPLHQYYDDRLALVRLLDELGFRTYHIAEHHSTPLGMAPSPTVYLSAVARSTTRLRFGPLVFALPLYHPFRLVQEICMVDQLSRGRLEIGFGRGASPIEAAYFGNDHAEAEATYHENLDRILSALSSNSLDGKGSFNEVDEIPLLVEPYQKPHPPLWYGIHSTESAARAARMGSNVVSLDTAEETRSFADSFRDAWSAAHGSLTDHPLIGLGIFVHVDEDETRALETARRAYAVWHNSFNWLFRRHDMAVPKHQRPAEFDGMAAQGRAVAGTPDKVADFLAERMETATANYMVSQIAFGDMSAAEMQRSVRLFGEQVIPALKDA